MNILYTLTSYPPAIGGAQLLMHMLACWLKTRHGVQVITQWNENRTDWLLGTTVKSPSSQLLYKIDGIPVNRIVIPEKAKLNLFFSACLYPIVQGLAIDKISSIILQAFEDQWLISPDVVHNCRIGREGISFASLKYARTKNIPFVLTPVHHPRWSGWFHRYYHKLYKQADAVIALTEHEKNILIRLGVNEQKIFITGMGPIISETINPEEFRSKYKIGDRKMVLFLGQKYKYKGIASLLGAAEQTWKRFPDTVFVFMGPRTAYSQDLFRSVSDERIIEINAVGIEEKTSALAACNLLCVPSCQESFGGVYTEAWSLSKPVIGGNIPAISEVIDDGENGFLVNQRPEEIADRIIHLISDESLAIKMGLSGKRKIDERFTWDVLGKLTENVYKTILLN